VPRTRALKESLRGMSEDDMLLMMMSKREGEEE
jgi:hypothetical protein